MNKIEDYHEYKREATQSVYQLIYIYVKIENLIC